MLVDPSRVAPVAWRNGAGATRELHVVTDQAGDVMWRVSLADLDREATFSEFVGMDRVLVALGELRLTIEGADARLGPGGQARFPGEAVVTVALDRPTQALNVMTRRGRCRAEVVLRRPEWSVTDGADLTVARAGLSADVVVILVEDRSRA